MHSIPSVMLPSCWNFETFFFKLWILIFLALCLKGMKSLPFEYLYITENCVIQITKVTNFVGIVREKQQRIPKVFCSDECFVCWMNLNFTSVSFQFSFNSWSLSWTFLHDSVWTCSLHRTPVAVNWVGENICRKTLSHIGTITLCVMG